MSLIVNVRHLETRDLEISGELPAEKLDLCVEDELMHPAQPLRYKLGVERQDGGLLVQGSLELVLACECARCLKAFEHRVSLKDWVCHLPMEGEDALVVSNDLADLTPYVREDILLAFPQHPLCGEQCRGLQRPAARGADDRSEAPQGKRSAWAELDKLKFLE